VIADNISAVSLLLPTPHSWQLEGKSRGKQTDYR